MEQVNSQYKEGDAVHNQAGIHADLSVERRRFWVCCVVRKNRLYLYRLKDKPKEQGGKTVCDRNGKPVWFVEENLDYFPEDY